MTYDRGNERTKPINELNHLAATTIMLWRVVGAGQSRRYTDGNRTVAPLEFNPMQDMSDSAALIERLKRQGYDWENFERTVDGQLLQVQRFSLGNECWEYAAESPACSATIAALLAKGVQIDEHVVGRLEIWREDHGRCEIIHLQEQSGEFADHAYLTCLAYSRLEPMQLFLQNLVRGAEKIQCVYFDLRNEFQDPIGFDAIVAEANMFPPNQGRQHVRFRLRVERLFEESEYVLSRLTKSR